MKTIFTWQASLLCFFLILHVGTCQREENFCYVEEGCGPETWGGMCARGRQQSPIALSYNFVDFLNAEERELLKSGAYFEQQPFFITNTGHTASVHLRRDLSSTTYLSGSLLGGTYVFSQIHFHWASRSNRGSEHTVDGQRMPMEAHLVHYSNRYASVHEALISNTPGAITVLTVFFDISNADNPGLNPIVRQLREVHNATSTVQGRNLVLANFLFQNPLREIEVIQYDGSLTTPDCVEVVLWNVFIPTIPISENQLQEFRRLRNRRGRPLINNFRPLQRLHGRSLRYFRTSVAR